jgi:small subunit ribosomal protein S2
MAIAHTTGAKAPVDLNRLFDAGAHFAQRKSKRHPSMKKFLAGSKANVELVDLTKTLEQIEKAKEVISAYAKDGKTIMFVGGKRDISDIVEAAAMSIDSPFVAGRWLGGTITNFVEIKKRIDRLADLISKRDSGELARKFTKLERLFVDREITRLQTRLGGAQHLQKRPDLFVVVDTREESHAVAEAKQFNIPIIGIMSSDCDATDAQYPIIANDASRKTVEIILGELAQAVKSAKHTG